MSAPAPPPAPRKKESRYLTTSERIGSFVGWAIILSLLVHVVVGAFIPNLRNQHEDNEVEKVSMTKKIRVRIPTPPPPTPTPAPTPTPNPQATPPPKKQQPVQPKLKVNLVKTTSNAAGSQTESTVSQPKTGSENGAPTGSGTAAPAAAPAATAKPACANPNVEATVTNPAPAEYPESALEAGVGEVQVLVKVTVGPSGNLMNAEISKSSTNMAIDQSALRTARQSSYAPKLVNCAPVAGDYIFRVDFTPS